MQPAGNARRQFKFYHQVTDDQQFCGFLQIGYVKGFSQKGKRLRRTGRIMKNVDMTIDGTILTIKVDLSKEFGPSSSGKTIIIASTEGNISVPSRQEKVGLNVYRKK